MLPGIIAALIFSLLIAGAFVFLKLRVRASGLGDLKELIAKLRKTNSELASLGQYVDSYVSREMLETLEKLHNQVAADLQSEKNALKETEVKLDSAQVNVEKKEALQQELKTAKEEDETRLEQLLAGYSQISTESVELEQKLAASLKNLDLMLEQLELTPDQRLVVEDLSKALTAAGGLLRDLITEHNSINERLNMLKQQHDDLEMEYTRLVEQQLGE